MKEKEKYGLQKAAALRFKENSGGVDDIRELIAAGSGSFAESIVQEALSSEIPVIKNERLLSMLEKSGFQFNMTEEVKAATIAVVSFISESDTLSGQSQNVSGGKNA